MGAPRRFDHDEARRLRDTGLSYAKIGERLGVSSTAVQRVCEPALRERMDRASRAWISAGVCRDCGGPATRVNLDGTPRCSACSAKAKTKVRDGNAYCPTCATWKPLGEFSPSNQRKHRGVHRECCPCQTERKRKWREQNREHLRAYDRERRQRKASA